MTARSDEPTAPAVPIIVGPTGVGKTAASLALAEAVGGEIISLDSRLFYRGMDIGTAKPTPAEQARVRHHLVDLVAPDQRLSLAEVLPMVASIIDDVQARGRQPILVGGTGQYVRALVEGWVVPPVPPDPARRSALEAWAVQHGVEALHRRLAALDPDAAARIDARNLRRVVRAIEIVEATGLPERERRLRRAPAGRFAVVGLAREREVLYARLDARLADMMRGGLEEEVRRLVGSGYGFELASMSAVGYAEWREYLADRADRAAVEAAIRQHLRRLVRRQHAWFGPGDSRITWLEWDDTPEAVERLIQRVRNLLAQSGGLARGHTLAGSAAP